MRQFLYLVISGFILFSCSSEKNEKSVTINKRYNILWLVAEDMSPTIACYGDSTISTPNLDWLAKEGVVFDNFYSTHGVCAPSRSAIATGMYPASIGTNNMRTLGSKKALPDGINPYSVLLPPNVKMHSELMRKAGYYVTNNAKKDYQFEEPVTAWDESSEKAHWRKRPKNKPFFSIFNFNICHESFIWKNKDLPLLVEPENVKIPPYYPDNKVVRSELARMYSNLALMDKQVGEILDQLKQDGLLDKTIIFWYSDHGGPLPRQKREIYDAGLKTPLIVRFPNKENAGTRNNDMISFVDLLPTVLSIAEVKTPKHVHGQAFLGKFKAQQTRKYIYAARDRLDTEYDKVRAVRDKQYKYIKNYRTDLPNIMDIKYRKKNLLLMQELIRLNELDSLSGPQKLFFQKTKPQEELYDCIQDPHELNNLASNPKYLPILKRLRKEHENWEEKYGDYGKMTEQEMIKEMFPKGIETTKEAIAIEKNELIYLSCSTEGASIGYQYLADSTSNTWQVYTSPIKKKDGIRIICHRIGYKPSGITILK